MSIKLFDISGDKFFDEKVPAERFMRFCYQNPIGRAGVWALFRRAMFSKIGGLWADTQASARAVAAFVKANGIDEGEFLNATHEFKTFNEFFTRRLKDGARPLEDGENPAAVSFPCDGRHLLVRGVSRADSFYVKGARFDLAKFLGDKQLAGAFADSDMLVSRLAPVDYHRFHAPFAGQIAARRLINGALFSVSPIALAVRPGILWENKRVLNIVESPALGFWAFVEIGATNVGSIVNARGVGESFGRGDELGHFRFGGSCVVSLFGRGKIRWNETLAQMSSRKIECYARAGRKCGELL